LVHSVAGPAALVIVQSKAVSLEISAQSRPGESRIAAFFFHV
jgi:hypothetical protein